MSILTPASSEKPLKGEKIALLLASGFNERELTEGLRALMETGAKITLISPDGGLVQGWNGTGFGHYHAAEAALTNVLAADFSMLLVLGGARGLEKLKATPHTARLLKSFVTYGNPIALFDDAATLLAHAGVAEGKTIAGPASIQSVVTSAGATWSEGESVVSGSILTGSTEGVALSGMVVAMVAHFMNIPAELRIAA